MKRSVSLLLAVLLAAISLPAIASGGGASYFEYTSLSGASGGVVHNIERAVSAIDGTYVPYGGEFSFNDIVGPRTKAYGYVSGENGRGSEVVGGGVSQVATTLYLTLLNIPGVLYTEVEAYGSKFTGDYVSDGSLAVVTDYSAGTDFRFENYEDDMTIYMWTDEDYVYCSIEVGASSAWQEDDASVRTASASFPLKGSTGLKSNVNRAANSISGAMLTEGDTFSFNALVGPRTEEFGYVSAVNGRGVNVVGGGVAQVASAIWLAVKDLDEITVIEKSTYGKNYNQSYVVSEADAILTDYNAGTDFSFRYTGSGTLAIYVYVSDDILYCEVYETLDITW